MGIGGACVRLLSESPEKEPVDYDVVIVGAGMVGAALASSLSDQSAVIYSFKSMDACRCTSLDIFPQSCTPGCQGKALTVVPVM